MKNRKLLAAIGLLFLVALVVIGIRFLNNKPTEVQPQEIKIGAILPLTGFVAYLGEEERNVLMMAQEEINAKAGETKVSIQIEDSSTTAKDGVSAYQKLRLNNIQQMITSLTLVSEAVKPLCEQDKVLQVALSVSPDIAKEGKTLIRPYYGLEEEMRVTADYLSKLGAKRVAALYINTPEYNPGINTYFKNFLAAKNITFVGSETYEFTDKSVRNQLLKLRALEPDYIMTGDFGYMYPTMLKEAQTLGVREKIFGGLGMMTAPSMPPELTKGIYFTSPNCVIQATPKYVEFAARYEKRFGKKVTFDGVYTYDAFYFLYNNLKAGKMNYAALLNQTYEGISGKIEIDNTGTGKVDVSVARFDDAGKWTKVAP